MTNDIVSPCKELPCDDGHVVVVIVLIFLPTQVHVVESYCSKNMLENFRKFSFFLFPIEWRL